MSTETPVADTGLRHMGDAELLALPTNVPLLAAGRALHQSEAKTYRLARERRRREKNRIAFDPDDGDVFPLKVRYLGNRGYVPKAELLAYLGVTTSA